MAPPELPPGLAAPFERLAVFDMPEWTHADENDGLVASTPRTPHRRHQSTRQPANTDGKHAGRQMEAALLQDRGLFDLAQGVGAAAGAVAHGVGAAAGAVAGGVGKGAKAIAEGKGVGAAAGDVAGGIGQGVGAAASAVANAGKAAGEGLSDFLSGSSDNDSDDEKKTKKSTKQPPPKTKEPPPPPPPPLPSPSAPEIPETSISPKQPPPPQEAKPPPEPQPQPQPQPGQKPPPKETNKPTDNIPPPKAEVPKPGSSADPESSAPATSDNNNRSKARPTSTADGNSDISMSTIVPGATGISVSSSILSLTPVITGPIPAITSGARKGIDRDPKGTTPFAARPSTTLTTSISPSGGPLAEAPGPSNSNSGGGGRDNNGNDNGGGGNGGLNPGAQKAMISLFTIFGVLALIAIALFFWRRRGKRSSTSFTMGDGALTIPGPSPFDKPKELARRLVAKVPILRDRFSNRGWVGIDEPYADGFFEKKAANLEQPQVPLSGPIIVETSFTRASTRVPSPVHTQAQPLGGGLMPKPSISSTAPQINLTLPSTFGQQRLSDLSSLSSGFGDGDIIVPPPATAKPYEPSRLSAGMDAAEPSQNRDTIYTQASEDTPPRFRTVNSWVRQQTGRVKREKQRVEQTASETGTAPPVPSIPPEQEFRLMMPDGEEPRRVEDTLKSSIGMAH